MSEEREFEVIDKRRVKPEGAEAMASGEPSADPNAAGRGVTADEVRAAAEAAAQQAAEAGVGDLPQVDVPGALSVCINMLNEVAWMKMGLIPNLQGKIEKDLAQAKVAIDAVGDLAARLDPLVNDQDRRDLQVMLSNLRINFVQQSQKG
jgi:Domain of unknown function (DUF1844)